MVFLLPDDENNVLRLPAGTNLITLTWESDFRPRLPAWLHGNFEHGLAVALERLRLSLDLELLGDALVEVLEGAIEIKDGRLLTLGHTAHAAHATLAAHHLLVAHLAHAAAHLATAHLALAALAAALHALATHGAATHAASTRLVPLAEALLTGLLLLREADVQRLALHNLQVHLGHSLGGLVGGGEADETEALTLVLLVLHGHTGGDGAEGLKESLQTLVVRGLVQVLHVEVHALVADGGAGGLVGLHPHLPGALGFGLGATHVEEVGLGLRVLLGLLLLLLGALVLAIELCDGLRRRLGLLVVHEGEPAAVLVLQQGRGGDLAEGPEHLVHLGLVHVVGQVLGVDVGEGGGVALIALQEVLNLHGLVADLHAVHALDGLLRSLLGLVVHEAIASRLTVDVAGHLAGEDVSKQAEGVVEGLVVDVAVQVLHEDVAHAALTEAGVALAPHDAAGPALDAGVVQSVQGALGVGDAVEVHVPIAKGLSRNTVAADSDGPHRAHGVEDLVKHRLCHVRHQVADVEGGKLRDSTGGSHLVEFFEEKVSSFSGFWGGICDFSTATTATVQE
mmetsp:Transcript_12032/g.26218  ORF Transcript_12032/g.26218 Transcript_12032/m.26218 type:complete len:566 (+) Transcript_12032:483-2180(+)